ncbi:hypothetical protein IPV08_10670 [Methylobacterium sp. SD274]|uniref:hypothetical protein n=1 Tax=Methylobacterium sp. SD274 TaxID=2782009 RepID=UPI001A973587|nr:hypothetical protein [Methylobacterium sp. SD274]MBO1020431.1 hypothetical protein [Methylobacterium sp. SD274]
MTKAATEKDRLVETLVEAGVSRAVARKAEILSWSKDDPRANERVHAATNTLLLDLLRADDVGKCIHVTGGARALTDPFHRQICEEMQTDDKAPFQVLYHVPDSVARDGWGVVKWNLNNWERKGFLDWKQKLRTLRMIGKKAVDLKAFDERSKIQFSVFGHRYAQVQGQHGDQDPAKYVWLIRSESVNGLLSASAETDLTKSADVDESVFSEVVSTIFSNSARAILKKISSASTISREDILSDKVFEMIDPNPGVTLEALRVISFVSSNERGNLMLTDDGAEFYRAT